MRTNKFGLAAASTAAVAALLIGGATLANAADNPTPTTSSASSSASSNPQGASQDTPVTGEEATKVSAAVTAKDSTVTVESVRKDPDGSYDVLGTKAGAKVMFDVSSDLATITENAGGPGGHGKGGPGGASQDTPVTGEEATKVSAAVTAKDSTVTVESVRKDPDGSYDVLGTKAGAKVMFDVSSDLATITENAGGPGGQGGHGPQDATGQQAPASTSTATTN
jgi:hypothetical protein